MHGPTLSQIARVAGVSKTTASYALRNIHRDHRISADTQQRISDVAQGLGWQPPRRARVTRPIIALLGLQRMGVGIDIYLELTSYLSAELNRRGADLLLVTLRDGLSEWRTLKRPEQVCGAILPNWMLPELEIAPRLGVPAVLLNLGSELALDSVETDDAGGMRQAVDHLIGLGHRRLLWIRPWARTNEHQSLRIREQALRERCATALVDLAIAAEQDDLGDLLSGPRRPTAIIAYSDYQAPRVMSAIRRAGLEIPRDISLIVPGHAELLGWLSPPVTTIEVPIQAMCREAVDLLMDRIDGRQGDGPQRRLIEQRLIIRSTTGPAGAPRDQ